MMKTYNAIFLALVFLVVSISAAIMLWSQPITGDLTRISGYPERWFGWNAPQQEIPPIVNSSRQTGKAHILVIGDSFSEAGHWQSLLSNKYTFSFIHSGKTTLTDILSLTGDKKPDAIVIETGERAIPDMYGKATTFTKPTEHCQLPTAVNDAQANADALHTRIAQLPNFPLQQRKLWPTSGNNISEGFHIFKLNFNALLKPKKRKAKVLSLTSDQLFSSTRSNKLLSLSKDFLLYDSIDKANLTTVRCTLQAIAQTFTAAKISFVILTLPDKTTAYQPYLADQKIRQLPSLIDRLHINTLTKEGINMLPAIRTLIASGDQDVYLPNDTHWGYKGFQLAAVLIDDKLAPQLPTSTSTTNTHD